MYKKILASVDLKADGYSTSIARVALDIAGTEDAEVHFVSILSNVHPPEIPDKEALEEKLMEFAEQFADSPVKVFLHALDGSVADEVLKFANHSNCDLIIMANHKMGSHMLGSSGFGTITAKVAVQAQCSVLVVKQPLI